MRSFAHALRPSIELLHALRKAPPKSLARRVKKFASMADTQTENLSWTIPLHVIMWTTIGVGIIMMMAVILMH